MVEPKQFWEKKINDWEEGRYQTSNREFKGTMEAIADRSSSSLRFRVSKAGDIISKVVAGKHVVELGCGRGLLARKLIKCGAKSYTGIDFAEAAILSANKINENDVKSKLAQFIQADVFNLPNIKADIVFSLGLLDWLNDSEMNELFSWQTESDHFHAIAEKRISASRLLHKAYCYIAYGYRTNGYVPRYFSVEQMHGFMSILSKSERYTYRNPRLSFGAFLSTFPINED